MPNALKTFSKFLKSQEVNIKDALRLALGVAIFGVLTAVLLHKAEQTTGYESESILQWSLGCLVSSPYIAVMLLLSTCKPACVPAHCMELAPNHVRVTVTIVLIHPQWGAITVIIVNSPVLGKCALSSLERIIGTTIGGWIGYAFYLEINQHKRVFLPLVSVLYAFAAAIVGSVLGVAGAANLSTITLLSGSSLLLFQRSIMLTFHILCTRLNLWKATTRRLAQEEGTVVLHAHMCLCACSVVGRAHLSSPAFGGRAHRLHLCCHLCGHLPVHLDLPTGRL